MDESSWSRESARLAPPPANCQLRASPQRRQLVNFSTSHVTQESPRPYKVSACGSQRDACLQMTHFEAFPSFVPVHKTCGIWWRYSLKVVRYRDCIWTMLQIFSKRSGDEVSGRTSWSWRPTGTPRANTPPPFLFPGVTYCYLQSSWMGRHLTYWPLDTLSFFFPQDNTLGHVCGSRCESLSIFYHGGN